MTKIILTNRAYVPTELVDMDKVEERFSAPIFDDMTCRSCYYQSQRPCNACTTCPAFDGWLHLWKPIKVKGVEHVGIPLANWRKSLEKLGVKVDELEIQDLRPKVPFVTGLKFTGKLFGPETPDRTNQIVIVEEFMRETADRDHCGVILALPRSGKCLSGSTIVNTERGFEYFEDLIKDNGWRKANFAVDSHNGPKKVSHTYKELVEETVKITTRRGFSLRGTLDHPVLVLTPKFKLEWIELANIKLGDYIVRSTKHNAPMWGDEVQDAEFAYMAGMWMANGTCHRVNVTKQNPDGDIALRISSKTKDHQNILIQFFKNRYGYILKFANGCAHLPFEFRDELTRLGVDFVKSAEKCIPDKILRSPKLVVKAFLRGHFSLDSGKNGNSIEISSASEKMVNQWHTLLAHGFDCIGWKFSQYKKATNSNSPKNRLYHFITFSSGELTKFKELFPNSKAALQFPNDVTTSYQDCNVIPWISKCLRESIGMNSISVTRGTKLERGEYLRFHSGNGKLMDHWSVQRMVNYGPSHWRVMQEHLDAETYATLVQIWDEGYSFEEITDTKIVKKKINVYDVTVPDGHAFTANSLVSHNSAMSLNIAIKELQMRTLITCSQIDWLEQFCTDLAFLTNMTELARKKKTPVVLISSKASSKKLEALGVKVVKSWKQVPAESDIVLCTYLQMKPKKDDEIGKPSSILREYVIGKFTTLIVDEAHQTAAKVMAGVTNNIDVTHRVALTATPDRKDGQSFIVYKLLGPVSSVTDTPTMVPEFKLLETNVSKPPETITGPAAYETWLAYNEDRNKVILKQLFKDLEENKDHCVLLPVRRLQHAHEMVRKINQTAAFKNYKEGAKWPIPLAAIFTGQQDRAQALEDARNFKVRVVVAIEKIVKHGISVAPWSHIYTGISPISNGSMMFQLYSRVCTPYPKEWGREKPQPVVRHLVDATSSSVKTLINLYNSEYDSLKAALQKEPKRLKMSIEERNLLLFILGRPFAYFGSEKRAQLNRRRNPRVVGGFSGKRSKDTY